MLFKIVEVYCENHAIHINRQRGQEAKLFNVKAGGTYSYRCALKGQTLPSLGQHPSDQVSNQICHSPAHKQKLRLPPNKRLRTDSIPRGQNHRCSTFSFVLCANAPYFPKRRVEKVKENNP
jgi:hypothetical protein